MLEKTAPFPIAQDRSHGVVDHKAEVVRYVELLLQEAIFNDAQRYVVFLPISPSLSNSLEAKLVLKNRKHHGENALISNLFPRFRLFVHNGTPQSYQSAAGNFQ
jgi:hypothetical protein